MQNNVEVMSVEFSSSGGGSKHNNNNVLLKSHDAIAKSINSQSEKHAYSTRNNNSSMVSGVGPSLSQHHHQQEYQNADKLPSESQ